MLERITSAPWRPVANFAGSLPGLARRGLATRSHKPFVHVATLLLVAILAAAGARAQDGPDAGGAGNQPHGSSRIVEIPASPSGNWNDNAPAGIEDGLHDAQGGPHLSNLDEFTGYDDTYESPIGAVLQRNCAELSGKQTVCGVAVLEVRPHSAAAAAGLKPYSGLVHTLLGAAVVGSAMVFPPAIAGLDLVEQSHVGESFDLIIGVDGQRIRSLSNFQDATSNIGVGDVLYLSVVRSGKRLQIPVRITRQTVVVHNW
jgi:hypothetical protein